MAHMAKCTAHPTGRHKNTRDAAHKGTTAGRPIPTKSFKQFIGQTNSSANKRGHACTHWHGAASRGNVQNACIVCNTTILLQDSSARRMCVRHHPPKETIMINCNKTSICPIMVRALIAELEHVSRPSQHSPATGPSIRYERHEHAKHELGSPRVCRATAGRTTTTPARASPRGRSPTSSRPKASSAVCMCGGAPRALERRATF